MLMSKRARNRFDVLLGAAASHVAWHYSARLQEQYEANVYEAASDFVDQMTRDAYEAAQGGRDPLEEDPTMYDPRDDNSPGVW